jgi:polysaccharide chain length determinant protein (PEP-CTERM system associated)
MLGHRLMSMEDYGKILRRRKWLILIPTVVIGTATYLVSLRIPNRYTSQTLVLIEEQRVPDSIVKSVVTGQITERLASMQEQILSRTHLEPIVQQFDLFNNMGIAGDEKVDELAKSIHVTPVRPMAETQSNQLPGFYINVTLSNPRIAQQVCSEVTSMFTEENLANRQQQAQSTTDFLAKQLDSAKQYLDDQDAKLAAFQQKYIGELPGEQQGNLNLLATLSTQLDGVNQALSRAQQDKTFTESLIAQQVEASKTAQQGGPNPATLDQQLQGLETELTRLQAQYTDSYPDVIEKKSEIEQVKRQIADQNTPKVGASDKGSSEKAADTQAATKNADSATKGKATESAKNLPNEATPSVSEAPQLQQLRTQLFLTEQEIREKSKLQTDLQTRIRNYEARVQLSPVIEEQFKQLTRDHQTAVDFYNDLLKNRNSAAMATDLERRQQGETFNILDPASLPDKPSYPNRPLYLAGGFGGGLAFGIALTLLFEIRDKSLRSEQDVEFFLKLPTLALVPVLEPGRYRQNFQLGAK